MIYAIRYNNQGLTGKENAAMQHRISYILLQEAIRMEFGICPDFTDIAYGKHGKPYFKSIDIHYNISHCDGLVCIATAKFELGIDAETYREYSQRRIDRTCTDSEKIAIIDSQNPAMEFIKFWTLKESYMKYTGDGLAFGTKNAEFRYTENGIKRIPDDTYIVQEIMEIEGKVYAISVCSEKEFRFEIQFMQDLLHSI